MSSANNFSWQQKAATRRMNSGHRPLHASGVSILAMADIAYRKTLEFHGPLGSVWRRMAKLAESANPLIYAIQYHWLAMLSFLDDQFLVVEKMIEKLFPPSSHVFVNNDDLVRAIMSLPEKFDNALNKFPEIIHQVPCMECVLAYLISWLSCLISTFNHWGLENSKIKEIMIDENTICNEKLEPPNFPIDSSEKIDNDESNKERFIPTSESEASEAESKRVAMVVSIPNKGSYKEAPEKGKEENSQKKRKKKEFQSQKIVKKEKEKDKDKEDESVNVKMEKKFWRQKIVRKEEKDKEDATVHVKYEVGRSGSMKEEDPILGLFESGWTI